jgi:exopolysaccharide production protein ExoZ
VQKLRSIQVLRGIAACAVVVLHAVPDNHNAAGNLGYGAAGVDLFFVISGFIMAHLAQERRASEFVRDRLWRIYPLWWIALFPWLFMVPRGTTAAIASISLWPVYPGGYFVPVLKVGWTLSFELLFYGGMALAILTRALLPLIAYVIFFVLALSTESPLWHFVGSPMALEFLMGVVVARLPRRAVIGLLIPVGLALLLRSDPGIGNVDLSFSPKWALWRALEWGGPAAMVVWGALSLEPFFQRRLFDVPVKAGDASYSIYLFHPAVAFGLVCPWTVRLPLAIAVGWAMHYLVERRIMAAQQKHLTLPPLPAPV